MISAATSRVVAMPRTSSSPSARNDRSIAAGRLSSHTITFAINEAVSLAKRYASEDAGRLVNGILARIQRETEEAA